MTPAVLNEKVKKEKKSKKKDKEKILTDKNEEVSTVKKKKSKKRTVSETENNESNEAKKIKLDKKSKASKNKERSVIPVDKKSIKKVESDLDLTENNESNEAKKIKLDKKTKASKNKTRSVSPVKKKSSKKVESDLDLTKKSSKKLVNENEKENKITSESKKLKNEQIVKDTDADPGSFDNFKISDYLKERLKKMGVEKLFPVQYKSFNNIIQGEDLVLQARTGSGKTLSFALPVVESLNDGKKSTRHPQVLVLTPTRELCKQVAECFESLCCHSIKVLCVYGGVPAHPQENALRNGVKIIVGTPGRVQDLIDRGSLVLSDLSHVILDEVDRMLDMGFAPDVDKILQLRYSDTSIGKPQTLLFSATMPEWVQETAMKYLKEDYCVVDLIGGDEIKTSRTVEHLLIQCSYQDRASAINSVVKVYSGRGVVSNGEDMKDGPSNDSRSVPNPGRTIIFCKTKRDADELAVSPEMKSTAHVIHGDVPQEKREMVLKGFREGRCRCLIATDVAARGLDIPEVDLVIQCSPPQDVESYIHRSGRTGRAGRSGVCVLFYKRNEEWEVKALEEKSNISFKRVNIPTTQDLIKAAAQDSVCLIDSVSKEASENFEELANELIEQKGASLCLSRALAVISGCLEVKQRSLLNNREGMVTLNFRSTWRINHMTYVWNSLKRFVKENLTSRITGMRFHKDRMGVIFDVPENVCKDILKAWRDGDKDSLSEATTLPELEDANFGSYNRNSYGGGGRYGNNRGGYGSNRGSYNSRGGFNNDKRGGSRGRGFGRGFKNEERTHTKFE